MPWKFRRRTELERANDQLRMTIVQLRYEVETKAGAVRRLELVVRQRSNTIDALRAKLEAARAAYQRLDAENEHLCEMVRLSP